MGNGSYEIWRNGRAERAGYNVIDICHQEGCSAEIDRGLYFLCGGTPGGDEYGCGGYFCGSHLFMAALVPVDSLCGQCRDRLGNQPGPDAMEVVFP